MEYIEPLGAIAPIGTTYPRDMRLATNDPANGWQPYWNASFDEARVSGAQTPIWLRFYDGQVYDGSGDLTTYTGKLESTTARAPRWALSMVRFAPPAGQAVTTFVGVGMRAAVRDRQAVWQDGRVMIVFPLHSDEYPQPFIHVIYPPPSVYNVTIVGEMVSQGPSGGSRQQGVTRETWCFEYEEDPAHYSGGHILIRNWPQYDAWWHYYHPDLRLLTAPQVITCAGAMVYLNLAPILYGEGSVQYKAADEHVEGVSEGATYANRADCWPRSALPLPVCEDSPWASAASWEAMTSFGRATSAQARVWNGWEIGVGQDNPPGAGTLASYTGPGGNIQGDEYRPYVVFQRNSNTARHWRPLLWLASEQHDATIASAQAGSSSTSGQENLLQMSYTQRSDWRGGAGSADFAITGETELYADWREGGKVTVNMGWQSGAGAVFETADVAVAYIRPGGLKRKRSGDKQSGLPSLSVEYGDLAEVRMPLADIIDLRQAGGMTVGDWASMIVNRLELPPSMLATIDAEIAAREIPMADPIPSEEAFGAPDGSDWAGQMDSVCNEMGLRWGINTSGQVFVDDGPPQYVHGTSTISYTLDHDAASEDDAIYEFEAEISSEEFRNAFKAFVGLYGQLSGAGWDEPRGYVHYWVEAVAARLAGAGMARWKSIVDPDVSSAAGLLQLLSSEWYKHKRAIVWEGPLRPGLRPDMFVEVDAVPNCEIAAGTVFQIVERAMSADKASMMASGRLTGVVVYEA